MTTERFACGCKILDGGEEIGRGHIVLRPGVTCGLEARRDDPCAMCGYPRRLHDGFDHSPADPCVGPGTYASETEATDG